MSSLNPRPRRPRTVFHYKIDHLLALPDAGEYECLLLDPRTTIDAAHAWLTARGYALSRSAVARHRRRFLARRESTCRKLAESEQALRKALLAAKEAGPQGFAAAVLGGSQLALFNFLMEIEDFDQFPVARYLELTKATALNIKAQRDVMEMQQRAAEAARQPPGAEAAKGAPLTEAERHD